MKEMMIKGIDIICLGFANRRLYARYFASLADYPVKTLSIEIPNQRFNEGRLVRSMAVNLGLLRSQIFGRITADNLEWLPETLPLNASQRQIFIEAYNKAISTRTST